MEFPVIKHMVEYSYIDKKFNKDISPGWRYTYIDLTESPIYPESPVDMRYDNYVAPVIDYPDIPRGNVIKRQEALHPDVAIPHKVGIFSTFAPGYLHKILPTARPTIVIDKSTYHGELPGYFKLGSFYVLKNAVCGAYAWGNNIIDITVAIDQVRVHFNEPYHGRRNYYCSLFMRDKKLFLTVRDTDMKLKENSVEFEGKIYNMTE